jgi:hypothetical protein
MIASLCHYYLPSYSSGALSTRTNQEEQGFSMLGGLRLSSSLIGKEKDGVWKV